jgi:hypothetical protein
MNAGACCQRVKRSNYIPSIKPPLEQTPLILVGREEFKAHAKPSRGIFWGQKLEAPSHMAGPKQGASEGAGRQTVPFNGSNKDGRVSYAYSCS